MTSGKQARRQRQQPARPPTRSTQGRKASPAVIGGALGVIALVVVAIVLALVLTKGSSDKTSGPATPLPESSAAVSLLHGIPQSGLHLGSPQAPVKMVEYIDLQCSSCQTFETQVMPTIIKKYIRSGKLQVEARPIVIIGPDSNQGARAMIAAARQNRGYTLAQILYYNQGPENGGWLTDQTAADAAVGIPGLRLAAFRSAYGSGSVADQVKGFDSQASSDGVQGTPTVFISKGSGPRTEVAPGLIPSVEQMSAAIDAKLNQ
jgi:protein-disulfide isomerase